VEKFFDRFREIWSIDFEYQAPDGYRPCPWCLVGKELKSGRYVRLWLEPDADGNTPECPFDVGPDILFVAFSFSAEASCFLELGWKLPHYVVDLYAEFAELTAGRRYVRREYGMGLLGALRYHHIPRMDEADKTAFRELAIRGAPFTEKERDALVQYCQVDVDETADLLEAMAPSIEIPDAIVRGWYMAAVAKMVRTGIPIDVDSLARILGDWEAIKLKLLEEVNAVYGIYEGTALRQALLRKYAEKEEIDWPLTPTGRLSISEDTMAELAKMYPQKVGPLKELFGTMGKMRLSGLIIGPDGRNRCHLGPFVSVTGRNQPSNSQYIFGPATWMRGLIKPTEGRAIAYVDWEQQEFGIAAALSGDPAMMEAYRSGDPYLAFAKQAGAVPQDATKESHKAERGLFKETALAVQYGMGQLSLSKRLGKSMAKAAELLRLHKKTYPQYWEWSGEGTLVAKATGTISTVLGWAAAVTDQKPTSLANFPMQANGAEMLRLACTRLTEEGIAVCAPVHDAILVEGPDDQIDEVVARTQKIMGDVSEVILEGFRLRSEAKIVRWPDRYMDERGEGMWSSVMRILGQEDRSN
jgi:hypothetical protein